MKIETLLVAGFGHFAGAQIGPLDQRATVIYGPNEAGKSTLLAFLRTMLFDFPKLLKAEFYPALNGGEHGGKLSILDDDGRPWIVSRRETSGKTTFELFGPDGRRKPDADLATLLGNASLSMFQNVFAFGLDDLQAMNALKNDSGNVEIFNAGMGARRLPGVLDSLRKQQEALFKKNGKLESIKIVGLLRQLESVESQLQVFDAAAGTYARLQGEQSTLEAEWAKADKAFAEADRRRRRLNTLLICWPDWVALGSATARLAELPEVAGFPEEGVTRLGGIEERVLAAQFAEDEAKQAADERRNQATATSPFETLLGDAGLVERLREGRDAYNNLISSLPNRKGEAKQAEESLAEQLRKLGPTWDAERVHQFDASFETQAAVDTWAGKLRDGESTLTETENAYKQAAESLNDADAKYQQARLDIDPALRPELDRAAVGEWRGLVRQARERLHDHQRAVDRLEDVELQMRGRASRGASHSVPTWVAAAAVLAGGVGIAAGIALGGSAQLAGAVFGGALLAVGVLLLVMGQNVATAEGGSDDLRQRKADATRRLDESAGLLGVPHVTSEGLLALDSEVDEADWRVRTWDSAQARFKEAQQLHKEKTTAHVKVEDGMADARTVLRTVQEGWRAWLRDRGLSEGLLPTSVGVAFSDVRHARTLLSDLNSVQERVRKIQRDIDEYDARVRELGARHGLDVQTMGVAAAATALVSRYASALEFKTKRDQAEDELRKAERQLEGRRELLAKERDAYTALLQQGGCTDGDEFRRVAREQEDRRVEADRARECKERIERASGPGEGLARLVAELKATSPEELAAGLEQADRDANDARDRRDEISNRQGAVENELRRLVSEEKASDLRLARETYREQLKSYAHEWAVLKVAEGLLVEAQRQYERERQPDVILNAQAYFELITGGRYTAVTAPLGAKDVDKEIEVTEASTKRVKKAGQLSQGTKEQLYLALRFGLVQHFADRAVRLPVIVDDILVNFDPERQKRAAEAFTALAKTNQVLVFTCHPETVALFKTAEPRTQVIEL